MNVPETEYERIWQMITFDEGLRLYILDKLAQELESEINSMLDDRKRPSYRN